MGEAFERVFLGWRSPPVASAARRLVELGRAMSPPRELDLSRTLVVLPGSRAGRLFLTELVRLSEEADLLLSAPRLVTPGPLQDTLLGLGDAPRADPALRLAVWTDVLVKADPGSLAPLIAHPPADHARAAEFARLLIRAHSELAGHGLSFRDAHAVLASRDDLPSDEASRWAIAAELQAAACARLRELGLPDPELSRLEAHGRGAATDAFDLVALIGIVDLPALPRRLLRASRARVVAMIAAPESESGRFDELGGVSAAGWSEPSAEVRPEERTIVFCADPAGGAEHAVAAASRFLGEGSSVAITAANSGWITPMKRALERGAGEEPPLRIRSAAGVPIAHEPFFQLLSAFAAHLIDGGLESLRALLKLPDAGAALAERLGMQADPLALLDRLARGEVAPEVSDLARRRPELAPLVAEMSRLRAEVLRDQPLHALAAGFLNEAMGLTRDIWDSRPRRWQERVRAAVEALRGALPGECDAILLPPAEALGLLLAEWRGLSLPDEPDYTERSGAAPLEIEALGWLETPLDPSSCVVIAGLNEGRVPTPVPAHPLLTPAVRRALALPTDADLVARDRALLAQILAPRRGVVLLASRRDAEGSPLWPSRLLLDESGPALASRVRRFVERSEDPGVPMVLARTLRPGPVDRFRIDPARPASEATALLTSMRVTDFRLYLESPLRFYLARVLKIEEITPEVRELDALAFGTLVHEAIRAFSAGPERNTDRADRIAATLEDQARRLAGERYGSTRSPAVRVQIEFAVCRLRELAEWQARRRGEGWEIFKTEWAPAQASSLDVDGQPMTITGRIDRIDRGPQGQIAILDYKAGNEVDPPSKTHLRGRGSEREWADLQLPLYTVIARELIPPGTEPLLGYVAVPRQRPENDDRLLLADWDDKVIKSAIEAARAVVRRIRRREFTEVGRPVNAEYSPITAAYMGERFLGAAAGADEALDEREGPEGAS